MAACQMAGPLALGAMRAAQSRQGGAGAELGHCLEGALMRLLQYVDDLPARLEQVRQHKPTAGDAEEEEHVQLAGELQDWVIQSKNRGAARGLGQEGLGQGATVSYPLWRQRASRAAGVEAGRGWGRGSTCWRTDGGETRGGVSREEAHAEERDDEARVGDTHAQDAQGHAGARLG